MVDEREKRGQIYICIHTHIHTHTKKKRKRKKYAVKRKEAPYRENLGDEYERSWWTLFINYAPY